MTLLQKFEEQSKRLAIGFCQCGQYREVSRRYEPGIIWLIYGDFPGSNGIYPENKSCAHRRIKKALIKAYRLGRNR